MLKFFQSIAPILFVLSLDSANAYAQELTLQNQTSQAYVELVDFFTAYQHSLRCDFAKAALEEIEEQGEEAIESNLKTQVEELDQTLASESGLHHSEKKLLKQQRNVLKKLLRVSKRKQSLQNFYEGLCEGVEFTGTTTAKALAHSLNVIGQSITLPVRFIYRFFKGYITGTVSADPQLTLYEAVGKNKYRSLAFYGIFQGYKALMASNPVTIPLLLTPMADYLAMNACENKTRLRPDEFKFCTNYEAVKNRYFTVAKQGEELGAKLSKHKNDQNKPEQQIPANVTDENLCEYLQVIHDSKTNDQKFIEFKTVMLQMNTPEHFSHPEIEEFRTSDSLMVKSNASEIGTLDNVIISLAPREEAKDEQKYAEYRRKMKELRKLQKIFGRLYRSGSKEKCETKKTEHQFSLKQYDELKAEVAQDHASSYQFQHNMIERQIKAAKGRFQFFNKTKLNWKVIPANTLNEVHRVLKNRHVGNVIILAHTEGNYRKLVDSSLSQFPTSFFNDLSPTLMSISFYSCHSNFVESTFNIREKLQAAPTIHRKRKLYFAEDTKTLDGEGSMLSGFGSFLIRVDNDLVQLIQGNMLEQSLKGSALPELKAPQCKLSVGNLKVEKGSLSVVVNRRFVGTINRFESATEFEFPCSFLDRDENVVLLQNHALMENLKLSQEDFKFSVTGMNVVVKSATHFTNPKTLEYAGSKVLLLRN